LATSNSFLKSKILKLEEEIGSGSSVSDNETKYEKAFQNFLAKGIDRSKMASMIYGISRSGKDGLGYSGPRRKVKLPIPKPKPLYEHFMPDGTEIRSSDKKPSGVGNPKPYKKNFLKKKNSVQIPFHYPIRNTPKVVRTSRKTNKKGPRKWVPKDQIMYVAEILNSFIEVPIMVPG
jgi:hypothetical protein